MELIFTFPFSKIVTIALKNSEYPWDVQTSIFLLVCFLNMFLVLFKVKQLFKNTTQRSALRQVGYRWQAAWEDMCRYLSQLSPPMVWKFIPEQVQSSKKLTECLEEVCLDPHILPQLQLAALCWGLACAYRVITNTIEHPQGEGQGGCC